MYPWYVINSSREKRDIHFYTTRQFLFLTNFTTQSLPHMKEKNKDALE